MQMRIALVLAVVVGAVSIGAVGCGGEETTNIPPMVPSPMPEAPPPAPLPKAAAVPDAPAPTKPVMAEAQKKFLVDLEAALAVRDPKKFAALYSTGAVLDSAGREG